MKSLGRLWVRFYFALLIFWHQSAAQSTSITSQKKSGSFTLSSSGKSCPIYASNSDFPGVLRALKNLKTDITLVQMPNR